MKLLLDEHLSPRIAAELRSRGHDVASVVEWPGLRGSADEALWSTARVHGRAIVTRDVVDFGRIASRDTAIGKPFPGLVLLRDRRYARSGRDVGPLVASLSALLAANPVDDALAGRVVWLETIDDAG